MFDRTCRGCRVPVNTCEHRLADEHTILCDECFRRLTSGEELASSPLCLLALQTGTPLKLLPGDRAQLCIGRR